MQRRALLIGVQDTPLLGQAPELAAEFPSLACARTDVARVGEVLTGSGYRPQMFHAGSGPELLLGKSSLQGELERFFRDCEPGDTALVYLSCHGVTIDEREYLLPADAQFTRAAAEDPAILDVHSLIAADAVGLKMDSVQRGVNIVVFLDTCRTDAPRSREWTATGAYSPVRDVVWVHSCGPGQRSYADQRLGSWFGRALAEALAPDRPPTTLAEVVRYAEQRTLQFAKGLNVDLPYVELVVAHGRVPGALELCQGLPEQLPWAELVKQSTLWEHTGGTLVSQEAVKQALSELADHVNGTVLGAGVHHDDPWRDEHFPSRFERRLSALVERAGLTDPERLSPAETAVLLAAPLVHEAVTAIALGDLHHAVETASDERDEHDKQVIEAMGDIRRAHRHVEGVRLTLADRGLAEEENAAEYWLRHRFVADWDRLWAGDGSYESIDTLVRLVSSAIASSHTRGPAGFTDKARQRVGNQVRQVLGHLTVEPGERPRVSLPGPEGDWENPFPPVEGSNWRPKQLAQLIWTAGLLAADPRRLSSVLIDHLGAHKSLQPQVVVEALADYDLSATVGDRSQQTYDLDVRFPCPHAALHVALEECAARAEATIATIRGRDKGLGELTRGLPQRVTTHQLRPEADQYTLPIERFRLAEDEIRPLLMGHQLYGDRMLALRELYQNALDSCRLRDMRNRYGLSQRRGGDEDWRGKITFIQGWDKKDRPFIECHDNGTGMTRAKLTSMFARAGKRYEQDPDYVQERREWRSAGLTPTGLNSRFGIGVFSYFMLADEVEVDTAPVNRYGDRSDREQHSRADIQSGSGLLRITPSHDAPTNGGTKVRLYLSAPAEGEQPASLVETLSSLLWVSDYEVVAEERDRHDFEEVVRSRTWSPGVLKGRGDWFGEPAHVEKTDVWLVQGEGRLLLDGVVIKDAEPVHGYVANLRERHQPEPSVDRNNLLKYRHEMLAGEVREAAAECAAQWKEMSLRRLWDLAEEEPLLAYEVLTALPKDAMAVLEPVADDQRVLSGSVPLAVSGCFPTDHDRLQRMHHRSQIFGDRRDHEEDLFKKWRLSRLGMPPDRDSDIAGYPDPKPMDALLFNRDPDTSLEWGPALRSAAAAGLPLRPVVRALRRYAIAGLRVPATAAIRALDSFRPTVEAADLYVLYREAGADSNRVARHAPMVWVSARHEIPLGRCADLLAELRQLDSTLPDPPDLDEDLRATVVTRGEGEVLSRNLNQTWFPRGRLGDGTLAHIELLERVGAQIADASWPAAQVARRLLRLTPLGFTFLSVPPADAPGWRRLSEQEQLLLRPDFGSSSPWRVGKLSMDQLVMTAKQLRTRLGLVEQLVNSAEPLTGVRAPRVPESAVGWTPPSWLNLDEDSVADGTPCLPWDLILQYVTTAAGDPDELREAVVHLTECGLLDGAAIGDEEALLNQATSAELSSLLYFSDYVPAFDEDGANLAFLLSLTSAGDSLGQARERLVAATRHRPLDIAALPEGAEELSATDTDLTALYEQPYRERLHGFQRTMTIQQLIGHAFASRGSIGRSVSRLSTFTVLGAPAPPGDFTGPDADALAPRVPDRFDLVAFDAGLLGPGILGPLELVLVAGRFGWTLARAYDRYAPFRCLGLRVTVGRLTEAEGALRPDWRDVVLLTEQLTGRAPALHGEVPADHIALCAEETELTQAEVRARLDSYAALFGFRLAAKSDQAYEEQQ
ncbi:caspase family protein [Streptomyces sp. NPDC008086]|uniref:HD domain-containing protein n=1 Tax=Streptomyces sp. NPDC008086 TaxID=3364807 RepID=UPI0036EBA74B